jgi:hypothetical protein
MAKKRKARLPKLSDQLRSIIERSDMTRYRICKSAQVDPSQMHRFLHGTGRLSTDSLDRIGEVLRLRLVVDDE